MSAPAWMPFYPADYLAATGHLTPAQHGAYLLLILHYWNKGGLPTEEKMLARVARMSEREWRANRDTLSEFFSADWKHDRIEKEIEKARTKSEARAEFGARGGNAKALKNKAPAVAKATVLPEQTPSKPLASSSQPQPEEKEVASQPNSRAQIAADFIEFWKIYPNKADKKVAAVKFAQVRKKNSLAAILAGLRTYIDSKPPDRQWMLPTTFLNRERWNDEPAPVPHRFTPQSNFPRSGPDQKLAAGLRHIARIDAAGRAAAAGDDAGDLFPSADDFRSQQTSGNYAGSSPGGFGEDSNVFTLGLSQPGRIR